MAAKRQRQLVMAVQGGNTEVVERLLGTGVDLNPAERDENNYPLYIACMNGHLETAQFLLQRGALPNADITRGPHLGKVPLMIAADRSFYKIVELLLENGAYADTQDRNGDTALIRAAYHGHIPTISALLKHGASISIRNVSNQTAEFFALTRHKKPVQELFTNHENTVAAGPSTKTVKKAAAGAGAGPAAGAGAGAGAGAAANVSVKGVVSLGNVKEDLVSVKYSMMSVDDSTPAEEGTPGVTIVDAEFKGECFNCGEYLVAAAVHEKTVTFTLQPHDPAVTLVYWRSIWEAGDDKRVKGAHCREAKFFQEGVAIDFYVNDENKHEYPFTIDGRRTTTNVANVIFFFLMKDLGDGNVQHIKGKGNYAFAMRMDRPGENAQISHQHHREVLLTMPILSVPAESVVAIKRDSAGWCSPEWLTLVNNVPAETQALFIHHTTGAVTVILPLVDQATGVRASLVGGKYGLHLRATLGHRTDMVLVETEGWHRGYYGTLPYPRSQLLVAYTESSFENFHRAVDICCAAAARLSGRDLRQPFSGVFANLLGWTTASPRILPTNEPVRRSEVVQGVRRFTAGGPSLVGYAIVACGWQDTTLTYHGDIPNTVMSELVSPTFVDSRRLDLAIQGIKDAGVRYVMMGHSIAGGPAGITPVIQRRCALEKTEMTYLARSEPFDIAGDYRTRGEGVSCYHIASDQCEIVPALHNELRVNGADGAFIENASSMEEAAWKFNVPRGIFVQEFARKSEAIFNSVIHSGGTSNDSIYGASSRPGSARRAANYSLKPNGEEGYDGMMQHILSHAINSVWLGRFTTCDWGMLNPSGPRAGTHAAARVLSGGPIYFYGVEQSPLSPLLQSLVSSDGALLRALDVGQPTAHSVFATPNGASPTFKMFNRNAYSAIVGIFCLRAKGAAASSERLGPADVPPSSLGRTPRYVQHTHNSNELRFMAPEEWVMRNYTGGEWEIATYVPVPASGIAYIGYQGKMNPGACVVRLEQNDTCVTLLGSGRLLFACAEGAPPIGAWSLHLALTVERLEQPGFYAVTVPPQCVVDGQAVVLIVRDTGVPEAPTETAPPS